jgi:hypothetical protein
MFVLQMSGAAFTTGTSVAGSPAMIFLVIHFAPALQSLWLFPGGPLESILTGGK